MSAKVGIPAGIFNFPAEKKFPAGFSKIPMGKYSFRMEGKKIPWEKLSKLRCYSFCKEIIPF